MVLDRENTEKLFVVFGRGCKTETENVHNF